MALFGRKKNETTGSLPPEVQNYYQSERRDKTWMAWLLALGTLLVTVFIILGLFFGGRWAVRKLRHHNVATTGTVKTTETKPEAPAGSSTSTSAPNSSTTPSTSPSSTSKPSNNTPTNSPTNNPSASSSTPTTTSSTNANLPSTGPSDTLAIFLAVTLLGYIAHRLLVAGSTE